MVQYEVQVMLDDLDTVIHMYSTTYNSSIYELTFWWSIRLTYRHLWHALVLMVNRHLDLIELFHAEPWETSFESQGLKSEFAEEEEECVMPRAAA